MNRTGIGLAVGAGYLLGRTKKLKLAFAVGSMIAGRKMNLGPRAIADLVNQQLKDNPQLKGVGDQVRQDLRGVGKAASGAMVERQMNALADRLHGRTAQVRDELAGVVPGTGGQREGSGSEDGHDEDRDEDRDRDRDKGEYDDYDDDYEDREGREAEEESEAADESEEPDESEERDEPDESEEEPSGEAGRHRKPDRRGPAKKAPVKKPQAGASARKVAKNAPAKKAAAKKTTARKTAAKKTTAAGNATRAARSRRPKGGGDR